MERQNLVGDRSRLAEHWTCLALQGGTIWPSPRAAGVLDPGFATARCNRSCRSATSGLNTQTPCSDPSASAFGNGASEPPPYRTGLPGRCLGVEGRLSRQRVWYSLRPNLQQPPPSRHCTTTPEHTQLDHSQLGPASGAQPYQACPKRFQPIIMSTMAAMFGAVGLACGRCLHVVEQLL